MKSRPVHSIFTPKEVITDVITQGVKIKWIEWFFCRESWFWYRPVSIIIVLLCYMTSAKCRSTALVKMDVKRPLSVLDYENHYACRPDKWYQLMELYFSLSFRLHTNNSTSRKSSTQSTCLFSIMNSSFMQNLYSPFLFCILFFIKAPSSAFSFRSSFTQAQVFHITKPSWLQINTKLWQYIIHLSPLTNIFYHCSVFLIKEINF